jgi:Domain of unknown function (DUF4338)
MGAKLPERLCGQGFGQRELAIIRELIARSGGAHRTEIAERVCEELEWIDGSGKRKAMGARVALLRLARGGWIELPAPRRRNGNGSWQWQRRVEIAIEPRPIEADGVEELEGIELAVVAGKEASHLWNALIARHHYLGYTPLAGAQLRYLIGCSRGLVGCLGFGAAAWKVAARDQWIGWAKEAREQNLCRVLNNARFLILPWVRVKNLASRVLSMAARRIDQDFETLYGLRPVLLETFVDRDRHRATCYRAANWQWIGTTQGRGKLDRHHERRLPIKDVYLYPLTHRFREELGAGAAR